MFVTRLRGSDRLEQLKKVVSAMDYGDFWNLSPISWEACSPALKTREITADLADWQHCKPESNTRFVASVMSDRRSTSDWLRVARLDGSLIPFKEPVSAYLLR